MKIGKWQSSISTSGANAGFGRIASGVYSGSSTQQGGLSGREAEAQALEPSPAVIDNIDYSVYSAIDSFLSLSGDERLASYSSLSSAGKGKFMKALSKMVETGSVDSSKLDLGDSSPVKQAFLSDYAQYSDSTSSPYSSDGKALG